MTIEKPQSGHILSHVLAFTHLLREMGVDVSPGQALELVRALEYAPITSREDFRGAARCTLIRRHEDLPLFDTAFAFYWRSGGVNPLSMLIGSVFWTPLALFITVLLRNERQYRWHIVIGGSLVTIGGIIASIPAIR